jgi:hypothetical protein
LAPLFDDDLPPRHPEQALLVGLDVQFKIRAQAAQAEVRADNLQAGQPTPAHKEAALWYFDDYLAITEACPAQSPQTDKTMGDQFGLYGLEKIEFYLAGGINPQVVTLHQAPQALGFLPRG